MSGTVPSEIEQFFADFEEASRAQAWARYGDLFVPEFLNLDPESCRPVARDDLIAFLPHRKAIFDRAGATGTALSSLETETMDSHHVLARTGWEVLFDHPRAPVVLRSTFLLRREDRWRIAVYLNHASLLELLAEDEERRDTTEQGAAARDPDHDPR